MATLAGHRWTALRSLLLLALLHRLNCLAFLAACAPVLLLTAFLLGVVLVHSDVHQEDEADRHLRRQRIIISDHDSSSTSSPSSCGVSSMEEEEEHLVEEEDQEEEEVVKAAVAWTADDERSIRSIGSLELERDARLEKLMSRRSSSSLHRQQQSLIDLDVHIPANRNNKDNDPGSAPSSFQAQRSNPFGIQRGGPDEMLLTRHGSFTAVAAAARASRFRPYFVADDKTMLEGACSDNSNSKKSSSSSSSSGSSDHQKQQQQQQILVKVQQQEEAPSPSCKWDNENRNGMAVDVELISDSSDDDMSLPGDEAAISMAVEAREHSDEDDSFEVASITQQVAAGHQLRMHDEAQPHMTPSGQYQHQQEEEGVAWVTPSTLEEKERTQRREVSEIREHPVLGPVPVVEDSSSCSPAAAGAAGPGAETGAGAGARAAGAGARAGAGAATTGSSSSGGKSSTKFKAPSKKAVFGFFRK